MNIILITFFLLDLYFLRYRKCLYSVTPIGKVTEYI